MWASLAGGAAGFLTVVTAVANSVAPVVGILIKEGLRDREMLPIDVELDDCLSACASKC